MSDEKPPPSLAELDARLKKAREGKESQSGPGKYHRLPQSPLGIAFRIGTELVAAMIVGVGGGLLLDRWLGTAPWGLIVMFFLGAAAGILNVYRAITGLGLAPGYRRAREDDNERPNGDAH
ncbi:AtpZ/AtpI family protein [Azospirillum brasilense]|uniref:ATP synthase protein I n=4 Tax=Azospirillum TaxID=191 RepID=A0A560C131_AZOBR|nr:MULTISPECIES: AtpZ/AtpI family protein [Azospirillum]AIB12374.1 phosphoribosylaminoimidazolecarboxamide formyltransferase [Azospirillum argentinense]ALJ34720.1 phosphoribosylaminoimidazolecarboxamide formyltransferase [Azospirillum brasilense]AWJ83457.1 phosphoribosylaminoimidazolecarboxamide formyltransferase [Azospirillum sp. TSH58]AWJ90426.1 phosphoribosylaminoimidazolecarboxamide formyltransferase [Azospirillum baldaniorum]EZQ09203.1 phosphoribosylaminoimidazolecarboxamide formyltransfe